MKKPAHSKEIFDELEKQWGREARPASDFRYDEPLDDLLLTILSQNTNDKNRDKAYAKLRETYPHWEQVAGAPVESVIDCIRVAGLGETKAKHIKAVLETVREKFGNYSLKALEDWKTEDIRSFLVSLPGIGVKTAGIVLVFDLGREAFPVDTHITRITKRLGWVPENWTPAKIQEYLETVLDGSRFGGGHLNFLEHGRSVCGARKPKCAECTVSQWCKFGKAELKKKAKAAK